MSLILNSGFEIIYFSDVNYEKMTVEILYKRQQVLQINKDKGDNLLEVEIYSQYVVEEMLIDLRFPLEDFLYAIKRAKEMLLAA
jgi:hypothetical protein